MPYKSIILTCFSALLLALSACAPKQSQGITVDPNSGNSGVILNTGGNTARPPLKLEWISPAFVQGEVVPVYKKMNIEIRAYTTATLKDGDFKVYVDEKLLAAKSGEAPLEIMRQEYIFRKTI